MLDTIIKALNENQVSAYLIHEVKETSVELFFVKKRLDLHREKNTTNYSVTVYRDFTVPSGDGAEPVKMRGASGVRIAPEMTGEEVRKAVADAFYAAAFVKNPYYEIPKQIRGEHVVMESTLYNGTLSEAAARMTRALFEADREEGAWINSAELFVKQGSVRILNSEGVDVSYEKRSVSGEFVVQCKVPQDVEMYHAFSYDGLEEEALGQKAEKALRLVKERAKAVDAPKSGEYDVILTDADAGTFFQFYLERADSSSVYAKYSTYRVGTKAQGDEIAGDRVTICLKAEEPYSGEGIPMKDRLLLENGEVRLIHGGSRFACYLGIEPTGDYEKIEVASGTKSAVRMIEEAAGQNRRVLEIVSFSDFQMDSISGYFGGEIRLAFLHENGTTTPVTGGSINGSIVKIQQDIGLSAERTKEKGYEGPACIYLKSVNVAGAADNE